MGKEIRAGLSVVGALLIAFCFLLYTRFVQNPGRPTDTLNIETSDGQKPGTTAVRRQPVGTPTIVEGGNGYDGSSGSHSNPSNPRHPKNPRTGGKHDTHETEPDLHHDDQYLPIAPATSDDFVSTEVSQPDAIAPASTVSVRVQADEDLRQLAQRLYGSSDYERALWQWLFDREQVEQVRPGATLELPTAATLRRSYASLVPDP